ncbi:uncharacterized protein LOC127720176 isoform X1 [Mytilus californianus]|uniref:uncharacterized protein LOC127720176 isoform X1 n=1 Tax=Mytilus californianus TaxID=6549 RepID=UPI00224752DA|nr:uncharacterized protein LOC127720176 isoform X1 [Mytilus californianus]
MPKLKRNCWTLPYHRKRRAIKQLQHVKSLRKKTLASTKPEEFTVEEADSGVVIGTGTIHDSYWSVTIPEDGNHFDGDLNNGTTQDIFKNEHIDLELEIDVDEHLAKEQCIQINGEEENSFEKIDIEGNCNTEHDIRIDEEEENSFETSQYVGIGSEMVSSESNELSGVVSPITSYIDNSYNTVQTDGIRLTRNEENSFETVQYVEIGPEMVSSENNELNRVVSPFPSYNSYSTVFTDHVTDAKCHQDSNDVSESNELGGVISPITLYNNNSYNTAQTDTRSQKNYHNGSESNISNDLVTVKVELPDGTTELLESIPYDSYQTVQSDIDLYGSHTDNVNIQNNKIMSESELFRITHNVNTIPDQSMPGSSTQSFIPAHDHVEEGQENCQEWDIGMLPFVMETMKEQENTQSLLDKNIQKAKKKKVQEAKWKAGICSFNRCCPGCDTFGNNVRKPTKSKKTKTTKTASVLGEEKIQLCSKRKIPKERCDFCGMVFSGASQKYKKQNHIIAEHCSKEVREQLRKRKKKDEVVYKTKLKFKYAEIKLNLEFPDELYGMECIECNKVIREEHFRKILKCTKCNYSSLCSRAYIEHMINRHGTKNRASNKFVPCSSRFMECACGFVHIEGNKMAKHINFCRRGRKSCELLNLGYSYTAERKHGKRPARKKTASHSLVEGDNKSSKEFDTTIKTENDAGTLDNTPLQKGKALDTYSIIHSSLPYLTEIQHVRTATEEELVNSNLSKQESNDTSDKDCFLNANLIVKATQVINGQLVPKQLPLHLLKQIRENCQLSKDEFKKVVNYYNPLFYHNYSLPYWREPEKSKSSNHQESISTDQNKSKSSSLNDQNLLKSSSSVNMKDVQIKVLTSNTSSKTTKTNASQGSKVYIDQNGIKQVSIMPKINEKGQLVLAIDKKGSKMKIIDTEGSKMKKKVFASAKTVAIWPPRKKRVNPYLTIYEKEMLALKNSKQN